MTAHVAHNSGNNEWYTPVEFIEAARTVMGGIDLDPASNPSANEVVRATTYYTQECDGLSKEWSGRVWMNPPYAGKLIGRFAGKLVESIRSGSVTHAIVLVNNATETEWFQSLASEASALCLPQKRIRFWSPDGKKAAPLQGQAFLCFGPSDEFVEHFSQFGLVVVKPRSTVNV